MYEIFIRYISSIIQIRHNAKGYTITESLIFLAVSAGVFVMVAGYFNGRQASAEFTTSVREMESRLQDIANDITTGYYNNPGTFTCDVDGSGELDISSGVGGSPLGTNAKCILAGKAIHFANDNADRVYSIYSIAGKRKNPLGVDVKDLAEAKPKAITVAGMVQEQYLPPGIKIAGVKYLTGPDIATDAADTNGIGFFTTFGIGGTDKPTSLGVNILPIGGGGETSAGSFTGFVDDPINHSGSNMNPEGGMLVCLEGTGINQYALLWIGRGGNRTATDLEIERGKCSDVL